MKHDSLFHPLKLILGFLIVVLLALALTGCASTIGFGYENPEFGAGRISVRLPDKGGLAK